jgi:nucleoid-associated protein Lsr2
VYRLDVFAMPVTASYCSTATRKIGSELRKGTLMAKRTIHMLVDDIDGGEADETVRFTIDEVQYEIDLSTKNATKMRDALTRYIKAGSKVGRASANAARVTAGRGRVPATVDRDQNRAIREWAQSKGITVSDRGRIKQEIVDRYHAEAGR